MNIKITEKHINMGKLLRHQDPISLALQETMDLDAKCIDVGPNTITLINYHGAIVYTFFVSHEINDFFYHFIQYRKGFEKKPKPVAFDTPIIDNLDIFEFVAFKINDWEGGEFYENKID